MSRIVAEGPPKETGDDLLQVVSISIGRRVGFDLKLHVATLGANRSAHWY